MFQLLIVDDEIYAARGLQAGVDWGKLGISKVHVAYNIRQAKELFKDYQIDIMICDIEMPEGNGLELLTWVRDQHPLTESIFLTCHADFDYAKKAIQLGSLDYMLKPARFDEIESVVLKAINKIIKTKEFDEYKNKYKHYQQLWSLSEPLLIERFWLDLLTQKIPPNPTEIKQIVNEQQIPYTETVQFLPILISVQRWHNELNSQDEQIMEFALRDVAGSLLKGDQQIQLIQIKKGSLCAILPIEDQKSAALCTLKKDCQAYIDFCRQDLYCDLSCYIGELVAIHEMPKMLDMLMTYERCNVSCINQVLLLRKRIDKEISIQLPDMNVWSDMLKKGCKDSLLNEIDQCFAAARQKNGLTSDYLYQFKQNFLQMIYYVLKIKGIPAHIIFSENGSTEGVTRSATYLQNWVKDVVKKTVDYLVDSESNLSVVGKVKAYIHQHLNEEVTRDDLAASVYLNPDYLSRLFKKETGISISDYLIQARMNIAKELLLKTDMSVKEIALEVGYSNFSHFSKIFKKSMNVNPKEFRHGRQKQA
ncbi:hypothetical protein WQ54_09490 [Bacillus sp. SA1-12]|uniref:response regulator transcription factor n=1 Tax=Bacillus sp. SA1-12 TaxID=1455638 RepID=UPI0006269EEC|nr:helix-turn-helix domain-containing protein [Bacillus sp. SA1-12]KKI92397.1 hypothetical protein WQ54_09490 [Bacillus sp. SA1-12]